MSNRITLNLAQHIALELLKPRATELQDKRDSLSEWITNEYEIHEVPNEIMYDMKTYPDWIRTARFCNISGNGINHDQARLSRSVPKKDGNYYATWQPPAGVCKQYVKRTDEIEKLRVEYQELYTNIEQACISFRTFEKLRVGFPEAYDKIPESTVKTTAVSVDVSSLIARL